MHHFQRTYRTLSLPTFLQISFLLYIHSYYAFLLHSCTFSLTRALILTTFTHRRYPSSTMHQFNRTDSILPHSHAISLTRVFIASIFHSQHTEISNLKKRFEHIELPAKLLDYFLWSIESNINQRQILLVDYAPIAQDPFILATTYQHIFCYTRMYSFS